MPIRYVVAVVLMVALLGVAFVGVTQFAEDNSESHMKAETTNLLETAELLYDNEEVPPAGLRGAQRQVTVTLPEDSMTSNPVEYFRIEHLEDNVSRVEYRVEGGTRRTHQFGIPIVSGNNDQLNLTGTGAEHELVLTLETDADGNRVVNIRRATNIFELVVNTEDGGVVSVDGEISQEHQDTYQWGDEVELTANATGEDNRWFAGWAGDVPHSVKSKTINVTMDRNRNITAEFAQHALEVDVDYGSADSEVNAILVYEGSAGEPVYEAKAYEDEGYVELPQTFTEAEPGVEYTVRAYAMDMLVDETTVSFEPGEKGVAALDAEEYVNVTFQVTENDNFVDDALVKVRTHETNPNQLWRNVSTNEEGNATVWLQPPYQDNDNEYYEVTVVHEGEEVYNKEIKDPDEEWFHEVPIGD